MLRPLCCAAWILLSPCGHSAQRLAILDFEANDLTSLPNTPAEVTRTGSIRPLLEQALSQGSDIEIVKIAPERQAEANAGFGYLFRYADQAAKLGRAAGADWVLVGQHSKPSFLFSYLIGDLVNVNTETAAFRFDIELKGNHRKVTERGVAALADKIKQALAKHY